MQKADSPRKFVDEMRQEAFFGVLYECRFPEENEIDGQGWMPIIVESLFESAISKTADYSGIKKLGVDIGRGGNFNVFVLRTDKYAWIKSKDQNPDLIQTAEKIIQVIKDEKLRNEDVFIDDTGVGSGVTHYLRSKGFFINAVVEGEKAQDTDKYVNVRAEMYWRVRKWLEDGGTLQGSGFLRVA